MKADRYSREVVEPPVGPLPAKIYGPDGKLIRVVSSAELAKRKPQSAQRGHVNAKSDPGATHFGRKLKRWSAL